MESYDPDAADDNYVPMRQPPETLLLTLDGGVCHASSGAQALLLMAEGGASRDALSRPLDALAGSLIQMLMAQLRERALALVRNASAPLPSIVRITPAGRFVATGLLLSPMQIDSVPLAQVTLQRYEPHRVALARALRTLPLSPTQMAVCSDLYHGFTHSEICHRMGVAASTVISHVRNSYNKLDVRSALELRAAVDLKIYPVASR